MKKLNVCFAVLFLVGFIVLGSGKVPLQAQSSEYIFWIGANDGVGRANFDGTIFEPDFIQVPEGTNPAGIAVNDEYIYWSNYGNNTGTTISRSDIDGHNIVSNFISGCSIPFALAIDGDYLYWINMGNDTIGRANLDGMNVIQDFISNGPAALHGIAVDENYIYWTSIGYSAIGRANLDGSHPNNNWISANPAIDFPNSVTVTRTQIYWTNSHNTIGRANLDGTNPEVWITGQDLELTLPFGIGAHGDFIYWGNNFYGQIGRSKIDKSEYQPHWLETFQNVMYIAFSSFKYVFEGFFSPIDNLPIVNKANAGQTIPVKWRLTDKNGLPVSEAASFIGIKSFSISCGTFVGDPTSEVDEYAAGASGLQYHGDGWWQFNWKTPKTYKGQAEP